MPDLLPLFLNLTGRTVLLVGGGPVATAKLRQLQAAGASVRVVAPEVTDEIALASRPVQTIAAVARSGAPQTTLTRRPFEPRDLDDVWLVIAAATPEVNRCVAEAAEPLRIFVNAVDDPANATAFLSGVVRRDGVTVAISTEGAAPALTALLREGLDAMLPRDLGAWVWRARAARVAWRREGLAMDARKPQLLRALNGLYRSPKGLRHADEALRHADEALRHADEELRHAAPVDPGATPPDVAQGFSPAIPWLNGPEDSWL